MLTKQISHDNYFLRIAQTYPIYENPVDDICRLIRRIFASFFISAILTVICFGTIVAVAFWGGYSNLGSVLNTALVTAFIFWIIAIAVGICFGVGYLLFKTGVKLKQYPWLTRKLKKMFCWDITNKFSYLKAIDARYNNMREKPVTNTCQLIAGWMFILIVLSMVTLFSVATLTPLILFIFSLFNGIPVMALYSDKTVIGILFTFGITINGIIAFVLLFGLGLYAKDSVTEQRRTKRKAKWDETKETLSDMKESKLKSLCVKLEIVGENNE